ncbi:MAG: hypothetical protein AAGF12_11875 [Myxococcota bacterium]
MASRLRWFLWPILGMLLLPAPGRAQDSFSAVVLDFQGRGSAAARRTVVAALAGEVDVVPLSQVESAARDQGVDLSTPEGMQQVSASDGISMFIQGRVTGSRRRGQLSLTVLDEFGEEIATASARNSRGRRGTAALQSAVQEMIASAREVLEERGPTGEPEGDAVDQVLDDELAYAADEEEDEEEEENAGAPSDRAFARIMAGIGFRFRTADVALENGANRGYDSPLFPEITLAGEVRPLQSMSPALGGLIVQAEFAHSFGLSTVDELDNEIGTSAWRLLLGLGYLFAIDTIDLGAVVTFGYDGFLLDENTTMPSAGYILLRPAVLFRIALLDQLLRAEADVGLRIALGTGDLAPFFGESASALGFDIRAGVSGALDFGFAYALSFQLTRYGLSFDGPASDPVANMASGDGGSDLNLIVTVLLGYEF